MTITVSDVFPHDPAAAYIDRGMTACGVEVHWGTPNLGAPYAADQENGIIWLPDGLPFETARTRLGRAWLYLVGGSDYAPEFREARELRLPLLGSGHAAVIPFPGILRRPW